MSGRELAAQLCAKFGLTGILESLPASPVLLVLTYHRIGDAASCAYDPGTFSASAEEFDHQVRLIKRRLHVTTLDEVLWFTQHPEGLRRVEVLFTFDDGYRDNYQLAFPILKAHGVEGTFFLVTSMIGTHRLPWWDAIAYVVRNSRAEKIELSYPHRARLPLGKAARRSLVRILRMYKSPDTSDSARFIAELSERCQVEAPQCVPERVFVTWDEAREMARGGMAIGSHTVTHRLLGKLTPEEQFQELSSSRSTLSENLGMTIRTVAFPVGSRLAFNQYTRAVVQQVGYDGAFSYYGGLNCPGQMDRFNLLRESVDAPLSMAAFRLRAAMLPRFGKTL
jgi:peptidoglycan/xylan/chitin deacetylase (PgdA/CDA1 family)